MPTCRIATIGMVAFYVYEPLAKKSGKPWRSRGKVRISSINTLRGSKVAHSRFGNWIIFSSSSSRNGQI
eukprot:scaffold81786_cov52-Attheya_sp.AAC.2